ncbi:MAG TPA: membrane protein insertion efficiency factor YidD [candidate division Zixibacteria bacterium]|nr:membrane protein insertion efficiency factor YidD [candidate division Zixibacteria bacterium]MDD4917297.1 membrane protein insertion efficiency factor YidD [candidate division Zixibacteria bacterium]MDM7971555.1 membrane protein insertion efficiency factor YidD [candidate division Zixibacteria bacterium]HOD65451.1 membrane protein insertion efficiency factor YidD [candidate division Zixibacteria bacterium]HOZ07579.1 membrane protein insertion efficiency factor YidD [candidate division Zixiba
MRNSVVYSRRSIATPTNPRPSVAARLLILLVRIYQATLSGLFAGSCRFYPSCSHYSVEALRSHGALSGLYLSVRRLLRCHPWHPGGYDPVPSAKETRE